MERSKTKTRLIKLFVIVTACILLLRLASCSGKIIYLDFDDLRSIDGVDMTVKKSTYAFDEEIKVIWKNNTARTLTFGESYYLVEKVNDKWQKVPTPDDIAFISIGYTVLPYGKANHTYRLHYIYNDLKAGTYRIVTHFFDDADISATSSDAYYVYAEITLRSGD
jgi:hypothetical protein